MSLDLVEIFSAETPENTSRPVHMRLWLTVALSIIYVDPISVSDIDPVYIQPRERFEATVLVSLRVIANIVCVDSPRSGSLISEDTYWRVREAVRASERFWGGDFFMAEEPVDSLMLCVIVEGNCVVYERDRYRERCLTKPDQPAQPERSSEDNERNQ